MGSDKFSRSEDLRWVMEQPTLDALTAAAASGWAAEAAAGGADAPPPQQAQEQPVAVKVGPYAGGASTIAGLLR